LPFRFKHPNEYYLLNVWFGLTFPGAVSYARSTFAEIIPIGRENEMYSMFLITQGGGGWVSLRQYIMPIHDLTNPLF
jgi:UMF1 family MFS transporter